MLAESERSQLVQAPDRPYLTQADQTETGWPKGVRYIIGNEGCERFSYYGMKAILTLYLAFLFRETGLLEKQANAHATEVYHYFVAAAYLFPVLGAITADRLLGKYNTILYLSIVYTFGHLVLSLGEGSLPITYVGLIFIAIGAGGVKPCVSAHVGDQFGRGNWHRLTTMYQIFYFTINLGSLTSTLAIPLIRSYFGWGVAFAVPGVLMALATVVFWMGRKVFVHVPPSPGGWLGLLDLSIGTCLFAALASPLFSKVLGFQNTAAMVVIALLILPFVYRVRQRIQQDTGFFSVLFVSLKALFTNENKIARHEGYGASLPSFFAAAEKKLGTDAVSAHIALWRIISIFVFVCMFWALFDQHSSTWVLQAKQMDLSLGRLTLEPDQLAALNPLFVMILIPVTAAVIYLLNQVGFRTPPLRRMTAGMYITSLSFVSAALVQQAIDNNDPNTIPVSWQIIQYILLTLGEVLVSITGLEFAYTQAPKPVKSTVMGIWLLTTTIGNLIVGYIAGLSEQLELEDFFWTFAKYMAICAVLFSIRALFYKTKEHIQ